jgi:hypothetical protein
MKTLAVLLFLVLLLNACFGALRFSTTYNVNAESLGPLVARHRALFTDTPSVVVFVEVVNNGSTAVKNVNVTVTFYDAQGNNITQMTRKTVFNVIMPQRRAPISFSISGPDAQRYGSTGRYEVSIASYEPSEDISQSIVVIPEDYSLTESNVTVTGRIYNNGSSNLRIVQVIGLFYEGSDDQSKPKGIRAYSDPHFYMLAEPLQPGATTDETFMLYSIFANNASDRLACIITAEAPERAGNQTQKPATVDQEVLIWLKGGPESPIESFDLRWIVLAVILSAVIVAGLIVLRRRGERKKSRWTKSSDKSQAVRALTYNVTDNLLFSTMDSFH